MRNTIARAAAAFALAVPMLVAIGSPAGAHDYPAENDCNGPYGAITDQPAPNRECVGMRFRDRDRHHGGHHHHGAGWGGGEWYGPGPGEF